MVIMEFKGTKGKWYVENFKGCESVCTKLDTQGDIICLIPDEDCDSSRENWEANALLISKAPEMLEMLEKISEINFNEEIQKEVLQLIKEATEL